MRFNRLDQWLAWLETLHPIAIDLGLARVQAVAKRLNLLEQGATVITVAGTNGKGSTIAALNCLLLSEKSTLRIGQHTSPHLNRFNERIVVAGLQCSDQQICEAFEQVDQARLSLVAKTENDLSLTYFEFTTLAALLIFKQQALDYILLEIGLGGRLDAVNIIDADISIISNIDLDHQSWLGETREQIGREKAAIARANKPVIVGDLNPPLSLGETFKKIDAQPLWANASASPNQAQGHGFVYQKGQVFWQGFMLNGELVISSAITLANGLSALKGDNWSCALQAYVLLFHRLPNAQILQKSISDTQLLGRCSTVLYREREWILDVGHNLQAVENLVAQLQLTAMPNSEQKCIGIFALLDDKPLAPIVDALSTVFDTWLLPQLQNCVRATNPEQIKKQLKENTFSEENIENKQKGLNSLTKITASVAQAIDWAVHHTSANDRIVICGSFYIVGEALALLDTPLTT